MDHIPYMFDNEATPVKACNELPYYVSSNGMLSCRCLSVVSCRGAISCASFMCSCCVYVVVYGNFS